MDKLNRLKNPGQFGSTQQERMFHVALELSITWINRILFLKLLEAQLITYHKGDKGYSFLNRETIRNYDDLNSLFFQVLARKPDGRNEETIQNPSLTYSPRFKPWAMQMHRSTQTVSTV